MRLTALIFAAAAMAALAACGALRDYHADNPVFGSTVPPYERIQFAAKTATGSERATCEAAGGTVERVGRAGWEQCVQHYPDAGKACSGSDDCMGECRVRGDGTDIAPGTPVEGVCQATDTPFGCYAWVERGVAGPRVCVD